MYSALGGHFFLASEQLAVLRVSDTGHEHAHQALEVLLKRLAVLGMGKLRKLTIHLGRKTCRPTSCARRELSERRASLLELVEQRSLRTHLLVHGSAQFGLWAVHLCALRGARHVLKEFQKAGLAVHLLVLLHDTSGFL